MKARDHLDYLQDILDSINDIDDFVHGMGRDAFLSDKKTINAVVRSLEVIGEAAKGIPESVKKGNPDIPWKRMSGMRDKLIHEYSGVDLEVLWKTITDDLPPLRLSIQKLVEAGK
jgi:uncharacterized protein with HEPN domain